MNITISLATAVTLTGWSERKFWRKFADGSIGRNVSNSKSSLELNFLIPHLLFHLRDEDVQLVVEADSGNAESQAELAILFLEKSKPKEAVFWLNAAVKQGNSNAMRLLGRAYIDGQGVKIDENIGMMWIAKAAASGDVIAQAQMESMIQRISM